MTHSSSPQADDSRARRNVTVLVLAQAILGSQMPMIFTVGGLAGQQLAPNPCFATLPISLIVLGSMLAATPVSNFMQSHGRRAGFLLGAFMGALGAAISAFGLYQGNFAIFLMGSLVTGVYMSAQGFYRFAAADTASDEYRPKAISYVMAGGLMAAVIGPQLGNFSSLAFGPIPFFGTYLTVAIINALGAMLFFFLDIPKPPKPDADAPQGRTRMEMLRTPRIAVAIIAAMVSYALMNLVMTSTPLAVVGCGLTGETEIPDYITNLLPEGTLREKFTFIAGYVVTAHVLAMYVPSFFTGHLIARFGSEKVIATGLVILAGAGFVALQGVALENFFVALILLGIGWNFGFIGATAMLAGSHTPEERGRLQGMNDFIVFGGVTFASLSSGGLMNCSGGSAQDGWMAVNVAMVPFLALAGAALIWLVLRPKSLSET
ncbi:MFS transporter [uncultured Pelagimonas sp.]|uniref:MFS transporter n=1 Tax=uncultured Pelagimonas sp. TaxID=1618102 RepID=UPI00262E370F|nr:MFS transporter [uncultured Pelagimonas sp.]